jgi:hypothetical protein
LEANLPIPELNAVADELWIDSVSFLDLFAWLVFILLVVIVIAVFATLGMMPGHVARKRAHPWAQAVAIGGWVTLIFGFVFWPLVMIWAYVDVPEKRGTAP